MVLRKLSSNKFVSIGHNEMGFEVFDLLLLSTEFATMAVLVSQDLVQLHGLFCESNELVLVYEFSGPMKASTEESSKESSFNLANNSVKEHCFRYSLSACIAPSPLFCLFYFSYFLMYASSSAIIHSYSSVFVE